MVLAGFFKTNVLYCGDNLQRLSHYVPDESVDLVYLDPPFFSNKKYEVIWGDEAEVRSFEDRWKGGINHYLDWMEPRLGELHRVLKPTGSIYLHCDWHAGHYLKVLMDSIFGYSNFLNEIVWHYRKWSNKTNAFQKNHDTIFLYRRSRAPGRVFNRMYMDRAPSTQKRFGDAKIISSFDETGNRVPSQMAEEESEGVGMDDVWRIGRVAPVKQLYPTEKPIDLLERIVGASSNPGDVVLDPFCGCGTTIAAAHLLGRQWVGMDISPTAVNVMKRRLEKFGAKNLDPIGMPTTVAELKKLKPFEFQNWVIQRFHGTHSPRKSKDMGIDGYSFLVRDPIQVKRSERVGRPEVDKFETAVERAGKDKGYIVAFSFSRDAYEEVARVKRAKGLEIELVKVEALLGDELAFVQSITGQLVSDLPVPKGPPKEARPPAGVLVESAQRSTEVA